MSAGTMARHQTGPITRENCTPAMLAQAWQRTSARFIESRKRGLACHNLRHNLDQSSIPETWGTKEDREQIATLLPERQLMEQGIINSLSEFWPVYRRQAIGGVTPTKKRHAGDLERWLAGCDDEQMDRETAWLKAAEDGEFAYVLMPDLADYQRAPSFSDSITDADYRKLDERGRTGWRYDEDAKRWKRPRTQYWRDEKNRPTDEYGEQDTRRTREAYEAAINTQGKRLPWVERFISMYDCAPYLSRGRGKRRYECTGLIVRTRYDIDELQRQGWRWVNMGNRGAFPRGFSRGEQSRGAAESVYLYEYYGYDYEEGDDGALTPVPFVAYSVEGQGTARWSNDDPGKDRCEVIDLRAEFGLDRLHVGYFWGMRTGADDPDFIGRPLLWPLVATIVNLEKIVTAKNAFDWDSGFSGYVMPIDSQLSPEVQAALVENGEFKPFSRPEPGEVVTSAGPVVPFTGAESSRGISENIGFHADRLQRNRPSDTPEQRASGASGHSMMVAEDLEQQAHRHLRECIRQVHEFAGQARIEIACAMNKKFGIRVPVEANIEPAAGSSPRDNARGLIEFDERWIGDVYRITSEFPKVGNLAEAQQYADFEQRGLVLLEEFREKLGDEDPENFRVLRDVEAYYKSPPAILRLDAAVAAMLNDQEEKDRLDAELAGLLTPEGVPQSAMAPDAMAGAAMPGVAVPNMAASTLGGIVAGEMGTASLAADAATMAAVPGGA